MWLAPAVRLVTRRRRLSPSAAAPRQAADPVPLGPLLELRVHQPVPGWLTRIGYDFGHNVAPALAVLTVIVVAVILLARR